MNYKIKLKKHSDIRINTGYPWVYSNEIEANSELSQIQSGSIVKIYSNHNHFVANASFNRHSLISARVLSRDENEKIDEEFFINRIKNALSLRTDFYPLPFYRLIHSEADTLPGLVIDRFEQIFVCQISTAFMENSISLIQNALLKIFPKAIIILRNDIPARKMEGLEEYVKIIHGEVPPQNILIENDLKFYFDPLSGQKTGWFFDQRENRKFISTICKNKNVLDSYCYNGGFGVNAGAALAKSVTFIDSSADAILKVKENIKLNNLENKFNFICGKVFDELENLNREGKKFEVVILDPPAFIKSKKDFFSGIKGYEKLTRIATNLVAQNGYLFIASCSHNANLPDFIKACSSGITKAGRSSKIIRIFGAGFDHPLHPFLGESEYLKSVVYKLD